jgi:S1-C subfamily serine protease
MLAGLPLFTKYTDPMAFGARPRDSELSQLADATVRVAGGSGVVVKPRDVRCVLTAFHVVKGKSRVLLRWATGSAEADVLKSDPARDLALLDCPETLTAAPVTVGDDQVDVRVGDEVWIAGYPSGWADNSPVFSTGIIGGVGQEVWVNADATWGNSGGPVIIRHGSEIRLVGAVLGRGGAVEKALDDTTSQLRQAVQQLQGVGAGGSVQLMGIDFGRFAQFSANALRVCSEFIGTHFRSGYVRVATSKDLAAFL